MRKIIYISVFGLALASCSFDNELSSRHEAVAAAQEGDCQIILSSNGLGALTRAGGDNIPAGSPVYVWADRSADASAWINAWTLTADGSGGLSGDARYFPADASSLSFYALCGSFATAPAGALGNYAHRVAADQTTEVAMLGSDLLYAVRDGVEPRGKSVTVPLNFYHLLTKVRVALTVIDEDDDLTGATLEIVNGGGTVAFTPAKVTVDDMETTAARAAMLGSQTGAADVKLPVHFTVADSNADVTYGEAIVIPQAYSHTDLLTVTLSDGTSLSFVPEDLTFESGSVYTLQIEVESGSNRLYLRGAITPWNEGDLGPDPVPEVIAGETLITPWKKGSTEADETNG